MAAMDQQALAVALEVSCALVRVGRAVSRESWQHVALNRVRLREHAERMAASHRRQRAREKLWDGRLPRDRPATIAGRPGSGERCAGCERITSPAQLVLEIPGGPDEPTLYLDADCFELWEAFRRPQGFTSLR